MSYVSSTDPLEPGEADNRSPAYARVARSIAGRINYLAELARGAPLGGGGAQAITPRNPDGDIGVNHSGPPWGSAFRHPLITAGGFKDTADLRQGRNLGQFTITDPLLVPLRVLVRPFANYRDAPYSRGYLFTRLYASSAASIDVRASIYRAGSQTAMAQTQVALALTTTPVEVEWPDIWADLAPGQIDVRVELSHTDASRTVFLEALSLCQVVKRAHS